MKAFSPHHKIYFDSLKANSQAQLNGNGNKNEESALKPGLNKETNENPPCTDNSFKGEGNENEKEAEKENEAEKGKGKGKEGEKQKEKEAERKSTRSTRILGYYKMNAAGNVDFKRGRTTVVPNPIRQHITKIDEGVYQVKNILADEISLKSFRDEAVDQSKLRDSVRIPIPKNKRKNKNKIKLKLKPQSQSQSQTSNSNSNSNSSLLETQNSLPLDPNCNHSKNENENGNENENENGKEKEKDKEKDDFAYDQDGDDDDDENPFNLPRAPGYEIEPEIEMAVDPTCGESTRKLAFWHSVHDNFSMYAADQSGSYYDEDVKSGFIISHLGNFLVSRPECHPVAGVTTPYLYFGMWKSAFCWHKEDLDLLSINYLHAGESKTWWTIPPVFNAKFEAFVRSLFPAQFMKCPEFLRHKTAMIRPDVIIKAGIPVGSLNQTPREFVINFQSCYHSGFNQGLNLAESTNFASPRWIKAGKAARWCTCNRDTVRFDMRIFDPAWKPPQGHPLCQYMEGHKKGKKSKAKNSVKEIAVMATSGKGKRMAAPALVKEEDYDEKMEEEESSSEEEEESAEEGDPTAGIDKDFELDSECRAREKKEAHEKSRSANSQRTMMNRAFVNQARPLFPVFGNAPKPMRALNPARPQHLANGNGNANGNAARPIPLAIRPVVARLANPANPNSPSVGSATPGNSANPANPMNSPKPQPQPPPPPTPTPTPPPSGEGTEAQTRQGCESPETEKGSKTDDPKVCRSFGSRIQ